MNTQLYNTLLHLAHRKKSYEQSASVKFIRDSRDFMAINKSLDFSKTKCDQATSEIKKNLFIVKKIQSTSSLTPFRLRKLIQKKPIIVKAPKVIRISHKPKALEFFKKAEKVCGWQIDL